MREKAPKATRAERRDTSPESSKPRSAVTPRRLASNRTLRAPAKATAVQSTTIVRLATLDQTGNVPATQLGNAPAGTGGGSGAPTVNAGNLGAAYTLDLSANPRGLLGTLTADCTITVTNQAAGGQALLLLTQDASGGHALTITDGVSSAAVSIPTAANATCAVLLDFPDTTDVYVTSLGVPGPQGATGATGPEGPSWSVTDGTTTVDDVTSLTVTGATVSGSAGAAALGITGGAGGGLAEVATTGTAGSALTDATPTILTWTAPNDGKLHYALFVGVLDCTSAGTGGQTNFIYTAANGTIESAAIFPANPSMALHFPNSSTVGATNGAALVAPGTTVSVKQMGALSAGAATLYGSILAV